MKKLLLGIAAVCLAGFTFAQDAPLWMRHSVISPDGTTIAFTYKGDIYTCLLYTSPSPRDQRGSRMPSSA